MSQAKKLPMPNKTGKYRASFENRICSADPVGNDFFSCKFANGNCIPIHVSHLTFFEHFKNALP
jgi:hypothetical protein